MDENLTSILLTKEELTLVKEAIKCWMESAKSMGLFGGLMLAALTHRDGDEPEKGEEMMEKMRSAGERESEERERKAYAILAKL